MMGNVWLVTQCRAGETDILKICATKELAEEHVKGRLELYLSNYYWVVSTDQPDRKVWADVDEDQYKEYEDPDDYYDDHMGCTFLIIEKWSVLTDPTMSIKSAKHS